RTGRAVCQVGMNGSEPGRWSGRIKAVAVCAVTGERVATRHKAACDEANDNAWSAVAVRGVAAICAPLLGAQGDTRTGVVAHAVVRDLVVDAGGICRDATQARSGTV